MRLGGIAKELARQADVAIVTHGRQVNEHGIPEAGPEHIVAGLQRKLASSKWNPRL